MRVMGIGSNTDS